MQNVQDRKLLQLRLTLWESFEKLADKFGYKLDTGKNPWVHSFKKEDVQVYVYHRVQTIYDLKFTVTTQLSHPTKGRTQLHRRSVDIMQLQRILEEPRVHTGKGYYKKPNLLTNI